MQSRLQLLAGQPNLHEFSFLSFLTKAQYMSALLQGQHLNVSNLNKLAIWCMCPDINHMGFRYTCTLHETKILKICFGQNTDENNM